ncbi:transforming acidic coiled-coil-containing protein 2-like isoform X2 [Gadus macrocephalus]|uniref:transforming acidic coiled-coil-containing protein 2-like isoform X2 n=1 Tax=Gadus macrocephalus TaxID=80720 RepID=UPI0028CBADCC|nr:transforming acidic coiled-coil-containing protein 2-like isoform X2 [Gadus macrocephalus]
MGKNRRIKRQEGDQETLSGDSSSPPGGQRPAQEEEATPDLDSSSPSPDPPPPHQVSTSSRNKERLRQVVNRWLETNEEEDDPDQGQTPLDQDQTAPDQGQTAPDQGQTAPDQGQTAPDQGQTAPDEGQTTPDQGQTAPDQGQTTPDETQTAPDQGQTAPDQGQTAPDQGQTAPDETQTAPDETQTAPDQDQTADEPEPQRQGEGSGPFVAWLHQTADGPPRKDLAQVVGNLKVRVKGVRKLRVETETMDPGQTAQDPNQLPNVPDSPPTKPLAQVMGNLRFGLKGFQKLRVKPASTSRLDEEKPLGQPSGRSPLPGQTAPDRGQTAPDRGQTAPDPSQIPEEPEPQRQGEGSGPFVAWLHQTADGPPRKDLAQVVGNLKVRVKGVRKLRAKTATVDPGQTPQDPNQLPNVPDSPPTKALAQVMGNLRFRVKGLKKKRVQAPTTSRLDEEKPLGHPSGRSPFPGQTTPDQGQTAPDPSQIPEEPDRAPTKDLSQVLGNVRVRVRAPRKKRVKTDTTALTEQEGEKPLGRPSRQNPFRRIKMAWADPKAVITTVAPPNTPEHQDLVIEAEEEGEATAQAERTGLRPRVNKWLNRRMKEMSTFAARFQCGSCVH